MGSPEFASSGPGPDRGLMHLNDAEARTVESIAARIIPDDPDAAGARGADVLVYIDRTLAGFEAGEQALYSTGIKELDRLCADRFGGPFAELSEETQDEALRAVLGPEVPVDPDALPSRDEDTLVRRFLVMVRRHTIEGFFGDPMYGGNRDAVGWRLVGFPGAHWSYTAEDMRLGVDPADIPVKTLADLRAEVLAGRHDQRTGDEAGA